MKYIIVMTGLLWTACVSTGNQAALNKQIDLILYNGVIQTLDERMAVVSAIAVDRGKIVATGDFESLSGRFRAEESIDLASRFVFPGFIDPHCHFLGYGRGLFHADLVGTSSYEDVLETVKRHHAEYPSEWILGRGWDQNDWEVRKFPTKTRLDERFPKTPVYLTRIDGHAVLVNQVVLDLAGVNDQTDFPDNLLIREDGKLTGVLIDEAIDLVAHVLPKDSDEADRKALLAAQENCLAVGLTSVTDCGLPKISIDLIDNLQQDGYLRMHVNAMVAGYDAAALSHYLKHGPYRTDKLRVESVKFYSDGALGSRGACLVEPYHDDPDNYGAIIDSEDHFRDQYRQLVRTDFQVCTHAIGDSANRMVLDLYGEVLQPGNDRRWRIEHAQVVHPDDIDRFGELAIVPSVQTTHCTSDMYWAGERLGPERERTAYAYKDLLEQNGWLPNGSDFPVEDINPLFGFYAAVSRQDQKGWPEGGYQAENALSREEALKSMTIWAAKAGFDEDNRGSLEAGKFADFVVLEKDIMTIDIREVPSVRVLQTWVDGTLVYRLGGL
jgi:predicted amidohydrolase YtcJ